MLHIPQQHHRGEQQRGDVGQGDGDHLVHKEVVEAAQEGWDGHTEKDQHAAEFIALGG